MNDDTKCEKIVVQVANHHLKYLLSKPLHSSQKIISEPLKWDTEILDYSDPAIWGTIEVYLKPNYEFIMEMLKFNQWVKIISPKTVVDKSGLPTLAKILGTRSQSLNESVFLLKVTSSSAPPSM